MRTSFKRLVRHFFLQFFQVEAGAEGGLSPTSVLALLASPGAIMSFLLFMKYSPLMRFFQRNFKFDPDVASLPDKYTFLALSMAVTGLVVVLRWESMFPDRRDFLNLAPLPVSDTRVLVARSVALAAFAAVFLFAVNICSTLLFPPIATEGNGTLADLFRYIVAHAISVTAAGVWTFATFLALTGTMMALLPYGLFRRCRRYVQFACIVTLMLLFLSASAMGRLVDPIRAGQPVWVEWLPSMWFLGLYQVLLGKAVGSFEMLAGRAVIGLVVACLLAVIAYGLSYRWFYLRTAETVEGTASAFPVPRLLLRAGELLLPDAGFYRGTLRFSLRTLARSDRHTAAFAAVVGLGMALAVQTTNIPVSTRPLPANYCAALLMIVYSIATGLRLCFGIPSELRAAWVFRLGADEDTAEPERVVRIVVHVFLLPVIVVATVFFGVAYAWVPALMFGIFAAVMSALLVNSLTSGFRVIPFTCAWMPGRNNLPFALCLWAVGLAVFSHGVGGLGVFLIADPFRLFVFLAAVGVLVLWLRHSDEGREPMVWADNRGELDLLRIGD